MGGAAKLLPKIIGPPFEGNPTELVPSSRNHLESPCHLGQAVAGEPIIRRDERLGAGKGGFHQEASSLFQPGSHPIRSEPVELQVFVVESVLNDMEPRI